MNLGNVTHGSRLRRGWIRQFSATGLAAVVGVFGLVGVETTEGRADAVAASGEPGGDDPAPVVDLPVPPRPVMPPEPPEPATTTTTAPVTTTTTSTTAPAPVTTTTTRPAPPPTTAPPPAKPAPAPPRPATSGPEARARVEAIADSAGWDWRAAGVRFRLAFHPRDCCHWGAYERDTAMIWIGPTAFADGQRLRYVVLHELAHAWQYRQNRFPRFITDYSRWGFGTIGTALEASADCIAAIWGAANRHYWACPAEARGLATRRLAGDWR